MNQFRLVQAVDGPAQSMVVTVALAADGAIDAGVQAILAAIETIAAHCGAYSALDSATKRAARFMNSGDISKFFLMAPFSQMMEPRSNLRRFAQYCLSTQRVTNAPGQPARDWYRADQSASTLYFLEMTICLPG